MKRFSDFLKESDGKSDDSFTLEVESLRKAISIDDETGEFILNVLALAMSQAVQEYLQSLIPGTPVMCVVTIGIRVC
jgi:hypothetical protein